VITDGRWEIRRRSDGMMERVVPWERVQEWLEEHPNARDTHEWFLTPACRCCGEELLLTKGADVPDFAKQRCEAHKDRNPCAIEGCKRTTEAPAGDTLATDQHICGEHWRMYVPARSRVRRAYNAHFNRAKKGGWTMERRRKFYRFWDALVMMARRKSDPASDVLDMAEINRIMGW
jgi:hypothetical protein